MRLLYARVTMSTDLLLTYCLLAGMLTITPGADTMLVLRNAMRGGRRDGWGTTFGITSGLFVHATASALGLSAILAESAAAFSTVKFAGALYLIWLGLQSWHSALRHDDAAAQRVETAGNVDAPRGQLPGGDPSHAAVPLVRSLREGFLTNVLNPKVAVFYLAFLPQFIEPGDPVLLKSILLAAIHNAMGLVWLGALTVVVARGRRRLETPRVRRWIARVSGALLIGFGVRLALEKR